MIKIIADSTCDLDNNIIDKYNIKIVPLNVIIEGKSYRDGIDIKKDEFYEMLKNINEHPTTSMPSPESYLRAFREEEKNGFKEIICICMSSGTSGSYQSAVIAKNIYEEENSGNTKIHIIDSYSMSLGTGWLIMKTGEMIEKGFSFDEIIEYNEEYRLNVKHFLCVDDLDNLIKSGRLNNGTAFIGKLLKIKPIMTMKDKKGSVVAKERGRKRVIEYYIKEFKNRVDIEETNFINIGYTDNIKLAKDLEKAIIEKTNFSGDIYIMQHGPAVGTHVGSGGMSMFYLEKSNVLNSKIRNRLKKRKEQLINILK